jgi:hypothetical protein
MEHTAATRDTASELEELGATGTGQRLPSGLGDTEVPAPEYKPAGMSTSAAAADSNAKSDQDDHVDDNHGGFQVPEPSAAASGPYLTAETISQAETVCYID